MSFQWPWLLWGLLLVPLAAAAYGIVQVRRAGSARRFASQAMMPNVVTAAPRWRRHLPMVLYLLGLVALLTATARPQRAMSVPRERATVVLVMDTSKSMEATDVAPDRLRAARRAADVLIDQLPESLRVGVVTFARSAHIASAPTTDRVATRRALGSIETARGTAIGEGLATALKMRQTGGGGSGPVPMIVVLLSDGNNNAGDVDPTRAARRALAAEVPVTAILIGRSGEQGSGGGPTPANSLTLRRVAEIADGRYLSAPTDDALKQIYRELGSSIATVREPREVTSAFVAAGLVALLAGGGLSALWFSRFP